MSAEDNHYNIPGAIPHHVDEAVGQAFQANELFDEMKAATAAGDTHTAELLRRSHNRMVEFAAGAIGGAVIEDHVENQLRREAQYALIQKQAEWRSKKEPTETYQYDTIPPRVVVKQNPNYDPNFNEPYPKLETPELPPRQFPHRDDESLLE